MKLKKLSFNKTKYATIILILLSGFFIMHGASWAKDEDIIITEIMYYSDNGADWIEIYNSGGDDVNIGAWKLIDEYILELSDDGDRYLNCHSINNENNKDFIIKPNEYVVISNDKSKNLYLKSLNLKRDGEDAVYLSNNGCISFVDEFKYNPIEEEIKKGYSLELDNGKWRHSYNLGGTPGGKCSEKLPPIEYEKTIKINEILPDPQDGDFGGEFIEIHNFGDKDIDLKNWKILDKSENYFNMDGVLGAKKYVAFYKTVSLNNVGDEISIKNPNDQLVDRVEYNNSPKGFSYNLNEDSEKWEWSSSMTPGEKNKFNEKKKYISDVRINEILPNPKNEADEFIELYNFGNNDIELEGWVLKDGTAGGVYKLKGDKNIKKKDFLVINKSDSDISLNNSGKESVYLLNPDGAEVDRTEYEGAREGISYNYCEKTNKWRWSEFLTPGAKNEFKEIGEIEIKIDDDIYKDIYAVFEVSMAGVRDKDLKVKWEFGDGKNSYKAKTKHKYSKNGKYVVKLTVSGSSEDIKKEFNIKVDDFPERKVSIVAINPNPEGKDNESEWIELKNKSKKKVNLKNWSIATGSSKKKLVNHPIYEDFIIKAGKIKQLTREFAKFSLGNKKGYVELRYPNGEVAYKLKYKKEDGIDENEIFKKKEGGGWEWLMGKKISPNKNDDEQEDDLENEIVEVEERKEEGVMDIDLIRDMTLEDFGKYSEKERANLLDGYLKEKLVSLNEKSENISGAQEQVLGVWDNKIKKIRTEDASYYFNPKSKEEKHYLIKFWEEVVETI
ncbi:MAG: Microbial collagenase [Candidatus Moranbacteria bacterium GW2011_GWF2_34_56]|nr:MAG: Microbial collagenase [Candidatus Moranbacteria bacterium GW2011_GWF1_34_10]KKP65154.1 MAG: Microbial collagenase [Candidatus Moranbacteria bacterium GW2011_GWF2_34_56]HBI17380.1 hypothetical protein [Candidatus Moranbacteria bacterium]